MKKILITILLSLSILVTTGAFEGQTMAAEGQENSIAINRGDSQGSFKGPEEWFTGDVLIESLYSNNELQPYGGSYVTFQPGARTTWHTHPIGQRLIITEGVGWVQQWGGPIEKVREGDVVWFPAGVKHWHGAAPTSSMTHIALYWSFRWYSCGMA